MIVFDTESDGFLDEATKLHVINLIDRETGAREAYHDHPEVSLTNRRGSLSEGVARLQRALDAGRQIAGHNIIKHDVPLIRKFFPDFRAPIDQLLDTLVAARLIWTDIKDIDLRAIRRHKRPPEFVEKRLRGKHSLEAWGYRLGVWKGSFDGPWDTFTTSMQTYGIQDPEVNLALIEKIEAQNYSEEAIRLEHRVAEIIFLQERFGFAFNRAAAERLEIELTAEKAQLEDELRETFAPWFEPIRYKGSVVVMDPKRRQTRRVVVDDRTIKEEITPGEPFCKIKLVSFEPGSRDRIASRLISLFGWVPVDYTPTGKPKVDETTLGGLDYPEAKLLIRYLTVDKRLGQLAAGDEAWLRKVRDDGRIYGRVNSNGAITGRMTHSGPNMTQVPKVKLDEAGHPLSGYEGGYGIECRGLFIAPPGKLLVGVDAEGLEMREMAHYMAHYDGGAYADAVVNGDKHLGTDAHSLNRKALGMRTRDGAKTWLYAYVYGAGDLKLGKIFYEDMTEEWRDRFNRENPRGAREGALARLGSRGRKRIEKGIPALGDLQKDVKAKARGKAKTLRSHDGRLLNIRAQHSALNTLLQGGGAVVMKKALVIAYDEFLARGWEHGREFAFVANVHDEFQMEAQPEHAEEIGQIAAEAIAKAGEAFGLRCPLAGSAEIGQTWADTH